MFIQLVLVFGYQAWYTSGLRVQDSNLKRVQKIGDYAVSPIHENCATSDAAEGLAAAIQENIQACLGGSCKDPFSSCLSTEKKEKVQQLATEPLTLCELGKLAKSGNFFAANDGSVLAKRIDITEWQVLLDWGEWVNEGLQEYVGGCDVFTNTLMVRVLGSFVYSNKPYLVMPNLTHDLAQASPNNWIVKDVYDAKPLPNLGEGLLKLFKDLETGWGEKLESVIEWQGWKEVRHQLLMDVHFLGNTVVDFSLFVHVLALEGEDNSVPEELEPRNGCGLDPRKTTIVCFNILDYMTPFTWKRQLESDFKASKFENYPGKFMRAVDCVSGDPESDCADYKALASITEAMSVSKGMAKGVFIGVQAFPAAYTCTYQVPHTNFYGIVEEYSAKNYIDMKHFDEQITIPDGLEHQEYGIVGKEILWGEEPVATRTAAEWLQSMASPERGTSYIGNHCDGSSDDDTDYECTKSTFAYANFPLMQEELNTFRNRHLVDMDACMKMVNEFSTEGYVSTGNVSSDMENVLWAPSQQSIIAVRGKPFATYAHKDAVRRGYEKGCLLKTQYLQCTPDKREGVYFNYKQHFGTLEVMVLSAREYSDEAKDYAAIKKKRFKTALHHELMFL